MAVCAHTWTDSRLYFWYSFGISAYGVTKIAQHINIDGETEVAVVNRRKNMSDLVKYDGIVRFYYFQAAVHGIRICLGAHTIRGHGKE